MPAGLAIEKGVAELVWTPDRAVLVRQSELGELAALYAGEWLAAQRSIDRSGVRR